MSKQSNTDFWIAFNQKLTMSQKSLSFFSCKEIDQQFIYTKSNISYVFVQLIQLKRLNGNFYISGWCDKTCISKWSIELQGVQKTQPAFFHDCSENNDILVNLTHTFWRHNLSSSQRCVAWIPQLRYSSFNQFTFQSIDAKCLDKIAQTVVHLPFDWYLERNFRCLP